MRPQILEHQRRVGIAQQQAQRLGRGQQHLRRLHPLPRLAVRGRVAGAGLDPDRQAHLLDRADQVALHVDRERLQRRDVERVQPLARALRQLADRRQEPGERLARAGRRDQQRASPRPRQLQHFELVPARPPALGFKPVIGPAREARSELVGPVAPALLFLGIELARPCSARRFVRVVAVRARAQHQPDQDDQQDRRSDDVHHPPTALDPCCPPGGTCRRYALYSSQWRAWVPGSKSHPEGIYVRPADAWIDPSQPKPRALITHGHSDHARGGHGAVLATPETLAIMECRYGPQPGGQAIAYDETIRVGDVDVRFVPAGHVLGSAQIVLEHKGEKIVVSGDYKRRPGSDLRLLRARAVRRVHHRGDLRPARIPPSRDRERDRPAAAPPPCRPEPLRAGRRLCARQGAADHHRAPRARATMRRSTSTARSSG